MMVLRDKYRGQDWFEAVCSYCPTRFAAVEDRLIIALRYTDIHTDNRKTFSYEFTSILRDCGGIFGSTMDAIVRGYKFLNEGESHFGHYRDFLRREVSDIHRRIVQVFVRFPAGVIVPFEEFHSPTGIPDWWDAYNSVKHSEYDEFKMGNLENSVTAHAALAILGRLMGWFASSRLFVNVGIAYDVNSIDLSNERRLFPRI